MNSNKMSSRVSSSSAALVIGLCLPFLAVADEPPPPATAPTEIAAAAPAAAAAAPTAAPTPAAPAAAAPPAPTEAAAAAPPAPAATPTEAAAKPSPDTVLAIVNGTAITAGALEAYLPTRPAGSPKDPKIALEELIRRELVRQDAVQHGLDKHPAFLAELETLRETLLVTAELKAIADSLSFSDADLRKFYSDHLKDMTLNEYKARHILVGSEEEAKAIIAELDQGGDFVKIAKEKSKDNAIDGGELGWFTATQMVKPVSDTVINLAKGKYTAQPVHSDFGWHIILHEDTREMTPPTFENVKDRIKLTLERTKMQEYIMKLRNNARVEIK